MSLNYHETCIGFVVELMLDGLEGCTIEPWLEQNHNILFLPWWRIWVGKELKLSSMNLDTDKGINWT